MQGACNHDARYMQPSHIMVAKHDTSSKVNATMVRKHGMMAACMHGTIIHHGSIVQAAPTLRLALDWSSDAWRLVRLARRRLRRLARRCTEASSTPSSTPSETQHTPSQTLHRAKTEGDLVITAFLRHAKGEAAQPGVVDGLQWHNNRRHDGRRRSDEHRAYRRRPLPQKCT
jgi:hypothetical protein